MIWRCPMCRRTNSDAQEACARCDYPRPPAARRAPKPLRASLPYGEGFVSANKVSNRGNGFFDRDNEVDITPNIRPVSTSEPAGIAAGSEPQTEKN